MMPNSRLLYASANGDQWHLIHDRPRVLVRHTPNVPSGGSASMLDIAAFLARGQGPEQQALLALIATLVDDSAPNDVVPAVVIGAFD
ncbi:hypothetical protein [Lichenicoccus sp.]|uniref:hypothetical protein n=1 Tax=Lichenicoccus sp. TaxID=2781899 RepID=UPI003D0AD6FE